MFADTPWAEEPIPPSARRVSSRLVNNLDLNIVLKLQGVTNLLHRVNPIDMTIRFNDHNIQRLGQQLHQYELLLISQ